jgi:hypothetical protein
MRGPVRRAGRAGLRDGSILLWSVAEGAWGCRWRASTRLGGALDSDLLLEVGRDGRPGRLEVTTAAGQLTLHPERDQQSAQGNVVGPDGVRPINLPWSPAHWFEVRLGPVTSAAMVRALRSEFAVGDRRQVPGLHVDSQLRVWAGIRSVERTSETGWTIEEADQSSWELEVDADGSPRFEAGRADEPRTGQAPVWPLEEAGG